MHDQNLYSFFGTHQLRTLQTKPSDQGSISLKLLIVAFLANLSHGKPHGKFLVPAVAVRRFIMFIGISYRYSLPARTKPSLAPVAHSTRGLGPRLT